MLDQSEELAERFRRDGYISPLRALDEDRAAHCRALLEQAEEMANGDPEAASYFREYCNIPLGFVGDLIRDPAITDPVAAILGEDLLVMACNFFIKGPQSTSYVSWHQDVHYWGLQDDEEVTAWIALSPSTPQSGCMRFVPGSHTEVAVHKDTFADDNLLTRGQEIAVEVDEQDAVDIVLRPGEMSLHHGRLFHASAPNRSTDRRIGLAIRYVSTSMAQIDGARMSATLARGEDRFGHWDLAPSGSGLMEPADLARHKDIRDRRRAVLYRKDAGK